MTENTNPRHATQDPTRDAGGKHRRDKSVRRRVLIGGASVAAAGGLAAAGLAAANTTTESTSTETGTAPRAAPPAPPRPAASVC
ncbi:hypothetical protein OHU10_34315 [Streptomyces europaeiscabiei]|nr:hypothetical protein [Streptomyces europaeiscabiei]